MASCLNNLAEVLKDKGDLGGAELMHRQALEMRRRFLGEQHPHVAESMNNLADLLRKKRDVAGAAK